MRIGDLAAAVGVSTRTVRHYHRVGVLPEPPRTTSGYRDYGLRDLVRLSHARRLVELGLGLAEVREVLADDHGAALEDVLEEMDAELAARAERIDQQRRRLAELRARVRVGRLGLDHLPEPELVEFFSRVEAGGASGPMLQLDREMLAFVPPDEARRWTAPLLRLMGDEEFTRRLVRMYDDFDRLATLPPDDPEVGRFVDRVLELLPSESRAAFVASGSGRFAAQGVMEALFAEMAPAQAAAARLLIDRMDEPPTPQEGDR